MSQPHRIKLDSVLIGDELGQVKLVHINTSPQRRSQRHRVVQVVADCIQPEPSISRAITAIRPIEGVYETHLDTTEKPNNLFVITNKIGQIFVCDTDAVRARLDSITQSIDEDEYDREDDFKTGPILSPVYYNMNSRVPVRGAQPVNQTNVLVIYKNGDIQHVSVGQEVLQSSLKIKRKAIKMLGLSYNSDSKAVHWRIDGSTGISYFDSDAISACINDEDPLDNIFMSSPRREKAKKRTVQSQLEEFTKSPCIRSRKQNERDRLIPTHVINMLTSRTSQLNARVCKWSSLTSIDMIYRKLAHYDLIRSEKHLRAVEDDKYSLAKFKLNDDRLAVAGLKYALRIYDVQTQKAIYNCRYGLSKNPLPCPAKGEPIMISDIDWMGGNKTVHRCPTMLATCSGVDAIVKVYDLRSPKPVYDIDLTDCTRNKWQPYDNQPRGCMFSSICASGAPYSTTVQSQQLTLGATNGQLHQIDLRFLTKSHRTIGKMAGYSGGSIRELRFVCESFESSKLVSCAADRFIRIHDIQTSFTSVISQRLYSKIFLGTKPTAIQPVCRELIQNYLAGLGSRCESETLLSTIESDTWSL